MNAIQVNNGLFPQAYLRAAPHVQSQRPLTLASVPLGLRPLRIPISLRLTNSGKKCTYLTPVCLSRAEGRSGNADQEPLWKSFGKAMEIFGKKPSVEDVLKQQIEKREYYEEGGSGGKPPGRGFGGGGGGGGFGEPEDEGLLGVLDETIQVILATLGFIFLYMYIISGAEIARLAKDYIKFLFGGKTSVRLSRVFDQWERFVKQLKSSMEKKEVDRYWLEKAIINTPTWWDHPEKYRRILRAYIQMQARSDE